MSGLAVVLDDLAKLGQVGGGQGEVPFLAIGSGQLALPGLAELSTLAWIWACRFFGSAANSLP